MKVGDIVTFIAIGRIQMISGEKATVRDAYGKKYVRSLESLKFANESGKKIFMNNSGCYLRHQIGFKSDEL